MKHITMIIAAFLMLPFSHATGQTTYTPTPNSHFTSPNVSFNVSICSTTRILSTSVQLNGTSVSYTAGTVSGCTSLYRKGLAFSVVLQPGMNTLTVTICNGSFDCFPEDTYYYYDVPVNSVVVSPSSATLRMGGTTSVALSATPFDANGNPLSGVPISWSSTAPGIVSISPTSGASTTASAMAAGSATVTASAGGKSGNAAITVQDAAHPASITVSLGASTLQAPASTTAQATVFDQYGGIMPSQAVAWSSGNSGIASVSSTGAQSATVTGVAAGQTSISASAGAANGSATITVTAPRLLSVSTQGLNPGTAVTKSQCLTIATGSDAAYECGDLRIVHALPGLRTMNRPRIPTLIYGSREAHPTALIAANVTYSGNPAPTSLQATLSIPGRTPITRSYAWNSGCSGAACRIVVPVSAAASGLTTGLYQYTLTVQSVGGQASQPDSVTDTLIVVDRSASPFGSGWWLDGLEQLLTVDATRQLWIGGDGSTRLYTQSATDPTVYTVVPTVDRIDTLKRITANSTWQRRLRNGAYVEFDNSGRHIGTIDRFGTRTSFTYAGALSRITLPVPAGGTAPVYDFAYVNDGSGNPRALDSIAVPQRPNERRVTRFTHTGSWSIANISDPSVPAVGFKYSASGDTILARWNRNSDTTTFAYNEAGLLKQVSLDMRRTEGSSAPAIVSTFCPAESRSIATCTAQPSMPGLNTLHALSQAYAFFDGPRDDVADAKDTTAFFVNRWGGPDSIVDALGRKTKIERGNVSFPMLATALVQPDGHRVEAVYTARGLLDHTTELNPFGDFQNASTTYVWDAKWDEVASVTSPMGEQTLYGIDAVTGNVQWVQSGSDPSTRASFAYTPYGLLRTAREAGNRAQDTTSFQYDGVLGNVTEVRSPLGFVTTHWPDALGRDTMVTAPIGATGQYLHKAITRYNLAGADSIDVSSAPDLPNAPTNTVSLTVSNLYDAEGNLISLTQQPSTDPNAIGTIQIQRTYDALGRLKQETGGPDPATWRYDPAGNLTNGGRRGGDAVLNVYDALNRPKRHNEDTLSYDPIAGTLLRAANGDAQVGRGYYPNGALAVDTLRIRTAVGSSFSQHVYVTRYRYDLDGRRRWLIPPAALLPSARVTDSIEYRYDAVFGQLSQVIDLKGYTYRFEYDSAGRLRRDIRLSGRADSIVKDYAYDADGRATRIAGNAVVYDAAGRMLTAGSETFNYDGLGHLVEAHTRAGPEFYAFDPFGNRSWSQVGSSPETHYVYHPGTGEPLKELQFPLGSSPGDTTTNWFSNGTQTEKYHASQLGRCPNDPGTEADPCYVYDVHDQLYYFDADRRLVSSALLRDSTSAGSGLVYHETGESRYDALGRRVFSRLVRGNSCLSKNASSGCRSTLTRTIWDGDQILGEIRVPGDTGNASLESDTPDPSDGALGVIGYVHAPGALAIDQPAALHRSGDVVIPIADARGAFYDAWCPGTASNCGSLVPLPATGAFGTTAGDPDSLAWYGSLLWAQRDPGTGLQYRRNRHYDAASGRFIQADPIGLAGGLNAYGFGGGDPVNFEDPFGLCPPNDKNTRDCSAEIQRLLGADRAMQSQMTNKGIIKASATIASAGVFGRLMSRVVGSLLGDEVQTNISDKISRQIVKRGWTAADIDETIQSPYTTRPAQNKANGNPATAFFNEDGSYVVRDNKTGDILQISNRNDPNWIPDQTIKNPYRPK